MQTIFYVHFLPFALSFSVVFLIYSCSLCSTGVRFKQTYQWNLVSFMQMNLHYVTSIVRGQPENKANNEGQRRSRSPRNKKRIWRCHCTVHIRENDHQIDAQNTGPFAPPFARLLAPLIHSLALHCSLCSRTPLRSFVCSLAHSITPELMGKWFMSMNWMRRFHIIWTNCWVCCRHAMV